MGRDKGTSGADETDTSDEQAGHFSPFKLNPKLGIVPVDEARLRQKQLDSAFRS